MSTSDTNSKENLASHYALHVALQTMKERCQNLQQRLALIEEENLNLRLSNSPGTTTDTTPDKLIQKTNNTEVVALREKISELTKTNIQLAEQLNSFRMVADENRQLWQRLSKLTKDHSEETYIVERDLAETTPTASQNLIRSKTFTQNAPTFDQKTREKLNNKFDNTENAVENLSVLDNCDFIKTSNHNYEQIQDKLEFLQLEGDDQSDDIKMDTKSCLDTMIALKEAALKQQTDLKMTINGLKQRNELEICKSCKKKQQAELPEATATAKPSTAEKSSATDPVVVNDDLDLALLKELKFDLEDVKKLDDQVNSHHYPIDLTADKREADHKDKMCPLCGKVYSSSVLFDTFQCHVESHFMDDDNSELSLERNFEVIAHSVGNF